VKGDEFVALGANVYVGAGLIRRVVVVQCRGAHAVAVVAGGNLSRKERL